MFDNVSIGFDASTVSPGAPRKSYWADKCIDQRGGRWKTKWVSGAPRCTLAQDARTAASAAATPPSLAAAAAESGLLDNIAPKREPQRAQIQLNHAKVNAAVDDGHAATVDAEDGVLDTVRFFDAPSAAAHHLTGEQGVMLNFTMAVDTTKTTTTYLTIKVNSSQVANVTLATVLLQSWGGSISSCVYPPEISSCLGVTDSLAETQCADPVFAAGDQYSTFILPKGLKLLPQSPPASSRAAAVPAPAPPSMPTSPVASPRSMVELTLAAPGSGKGSRSQTILQAWTHTTPMLSGVTPASGSPPAPAPPTPGPSGVSQHDYLLATVDQAVWHMMEMQLWGSAWNEAVATNPALAIMTGAIWPRFNSTGKPATYYSNMPKDKIKAEIAGGAGSNNNLFRGLEIMARMYMFEQSKYYRDIDVLKRVVAGECA